MTYKLSPKQIERAVDRASGFLFDYCREHDKHYLVTGVSGGLDSAVVLGLAEQAQQMAERENFRLFSIGLIMPCVSDPQHAELGRQAIRHFAAEEIVINLDEAFFLINLLQNGFDPDGSRLQIDNLAAIDGVADEVVYKLAERTLNAAYKRSGTSFPTRKELKLPTVNEMEI